MLLNLFWGKYKTVHGSWKMKSFSTQDKDATKTPLKSTSRKTWTHRPKDIADKTGTKLLHCILKCSWKCTTISNHQTIVEPYFSKRIFWCFWKSTPVILSLIPWLFWSWYLITGCSMIIKVLVLFISFWKVQSSIRSMKNELPTLQSTCLKWTYWLVNTT